MEVDSRPSDAIALAVRTQAPIFADESVVEKAGVQMDRETGNPLAAGDRDAKQRPLGDEELKSLSAFSDFFKTLDLEGIGREEQPPAAESNP